MTATSPTGRPSAEETAQSPFRARLHTIIFESETTAGRLFDLGLLLAILVSVAAVMLESVTSIAEVIGPQLRAIEWTLTILFTLEYGLRLLAVRHPWRYATSLYGVIDLLAVAPSYVALLVTGTQYFLILRVLRLLRIFRILQLPEFLGEANLLLTALRSSRRKIIVFLGAVTTIVIVVGAIMYVIEGPANGFTSIPKSVYWAVVTLTTVGYGDIAPRTPAGQFLAILVMLMGYGIIAVPTGIVSSEIALAMRNNPLKGTQNACPACGQEGHDTDAKHCKHCGAVL
jgi:voltage-gated potassium channel